MASPAPSTASPPDPDSSGPAEASPLKTFKQIMKYVPGFLAIVYLTGFVVVGAHNSRHGIVTLDLVRPKMIAAGLSCLALGAGCMTLLNPLSQKDMFGWAYRIWFVSVLLLVIIKFRSGPETQFAFWVIAVLICGQVFKILPMYRPDHGTLWIMSKVILGPSMAFVLAFAFGLFVYGEMNPAIGGGKPRPVVIHFARITSFCAALDCAAYLLEENDKGYYLAHGLSETVSTFVPRETVGSVDFHEMPEFARFNYNRPAK